MAVGHRRQEECNLLKILKNMRDNPKCKICRRVGEKLFLKGERCFSQKCEMIKKPYAPGPKGKRRKSPLSEYGKEWREVQKIKNMYGLPGAQLRKYVKEILKKHRKTGSMRSKEGSEDASSLLVKRLELRLDNAVFKLGFSVSRRQARNLVSHNHFAVNGKSVKIASFDLKKGDTITIKPSSAKKTIFQKLPTMLKKHNPPSWLSLNLEKIEGKVIGAPTLEEAALPIEVPAIFEFYSR